MCHAILAYFEKPILTIATGCRLRLLESAFTDFDAAIGMAPGVIPVDAALLGWCSWTLQIR